MKRIIALLLAVVMCVGLLAACGGNDGKDDAKLSKTQEIIKQAQGMTLEELARKAIEESNGKKFYGVGN